METASGATDNGMKTTNWTTLGAEAKKNDRPKTARNKKEWRGTIERPTISNL